MSRCDTSWRRFAGLSPARAVPSATRGQCPTNRVLGHAPGQPLPRTVTGWRLLLRQTARRGDRFHCPPVRPDDRGHLIHSVAHLGIRPAPSRLGRRWRDMDVIITDRPFALFDGTGTYTRLIGRDGRPYPERRIWWFSGSDVFQTHNSLENGYKVTFSHEFLHLVQWNVLLSIGRSSCRAGAGRAPTGYPSWIRRSTTGWPSSSHALMPEKRLPVPVAIRSLWAPPLPLKRSTEGRRGSS